MVESESESESVEAAIPKERDLWREARIRKTSRLWFPTSPMSGSLSDPTRFRRLSKTDNVDGRPQFCSSLSDRPIRSSRVG
jgi:hypothetical protein